MGCLFNPQRSGYMLLMMQVFAVQLVGMLACLAFTVLAQFDVSEAVTASASFPDVAITCVGNLAVFFSCLLRGRLHVEMGARDLLATITLEKLEKVESGLTTPYFSDVVMLSNQTPASSIRQFMQYIQNSHDVDSVLLQFHSLRSGEVTAETCNNAHECRCIVIEAVSDLYIKILAYRMPGVLKRLSGSQFLLPCLTCRTNRCHGCNHGMLHVEGEWGEVGEWDQETFRVGGPSEGPVPAVCEILDEAVRPIYENPSCICIPWRRAEADSWTKMLIRLLKTKDKKDREVTNPASEALQKYIARSGVCDAEEEYGTVPLILPRVVEILINIMLTFWFRVDGFSTSLTARRVIRDYIVDGRGTGIAANAFLKKCEVYFNAENTDVCQVLTFRGSLLNFRMFSFIIGGVNLICSISWCVLIAIPGMNWYDKQSMAPSKARIVILIAAIGIAFLMDCLQFYLYHSRAIRERHHPLKLQIILSLVMILEIVCIIVGSAIPGTLGIKGFGKWTYSAIQVLVWVKWGFGSYFLGGYSMDRTGYRIQLKVSWASDLSAGHGLMCASAFLLNAVLAGVRGHWKYSQS